MAGMKTRHTARAEISGDTTAGEVLSWLSGIPEYAKVKINHVPGDRPFDPSQDSILATWEDRHG